MIAPFRISLVVATWLGILRDAAGQEPGRAPDLGQLRDITGIEKLPPLPPAPQWPYWLAAGILSVLAASFVGWKLSRRSRAVRTPTPAELARRELDRIEALGLGTDPDGFSTLVSQAVREYLHLRFGLRAPRQTTAEFLAAARGDQRLSADGRELLRGLLEQCDLAKFARSGLTADECAALLATARRFVDQADATDPAKLP